MIYNNIVEGIFLKRLNRFVALVKIKGHVKRVHVKNTGRLKELLVEGVECFLQEHDSKNRKTKYSLIGVKKGDRIINIDSQASNKVFREAIDQGLILPGLEGPIIHTRPEASFADSRLDFYLETGKDKAYVELKGVTLELGGVAKFPDAPTIRGVKHIRDLIRARALGYKAFVVFIVQMEGVEYFSPNDEMHAEFGQALREASELGVRVLAYGCELGPDSLLLGRQLAVKL